MDGRVVLVRAMAPHLLLLLLLLLLVSALHSMAFDSSCMRCIHCIAFIAFIAFIPWVGWVAFIAWMAWVASVVCHAPCMRSVQAQGNAVGQASVEDESEQQPTQRCGPRDAGEIVAGSTLD